MNHTIKLEKAGTNSDQAPVAYITGPADTGPDFESIKGQVFHIDGQPKDVLWRAVAMTPTE